MYPRYAKVLRLTATSRDMRQFLSRLLSCGESCGHADRTETASPSSSSTPVSNPLVARLQSGDTCAGEFTGLLVVCSWPMPDAVLKQYGAFCTRLRASLPEEAYIYPPSTLHITVATIRPFNSGKALTPAELETEMKVWRPVLERARANDKWPRGGFALRMDPPTLGKTAAIFRYEDIDGGIEKMRECLQESIAEAGGVSGVGSDTRGGKSLPGSQAPPPHIPDIVHSTLMRWAGEPPESWAGAAGAEKAETYGQWESLAEAWEPMAITVRGGAKAVLEDAPFMHIHPSPWQQRFEAGWEKEWLKECARSTWWSSDRGSSS